MVNVSFYLVFGIPSRLPACHIHISWNSSIRHPTFALRSQTNKQYLASNDNKYLCNISDSRMPLHILCVCVYVLCVEPLSQFAVTIKSFLNEKKMIKNDNDNGKESSTNNIWINRSYSTCTRMTNCSPRIVVSTVLEDNKNREEKIKAFTAFSLSVAVSAVRRVASYITLHMRTIVTRKRW